VNFDPDWFSIFSVFYNDISYYICLAAIKFRIVYLPSDIYLSMAPQSLADGPWPIFQLLNPIHRR
jgi:hypothetical protein